MEIVKIALAVFLGWQIGAMLAGLAFNQGRYITATLTIIAWFAFLFII